MASVGVVLTTVTAIKDTPKAIDAIHADSCKRHSGDPHAYTKKEALVSAYRYYIPTAIIGGSTILCIAGACILSGRNQAALTGAYALLRNSYREYKGKLKELYGEEAHHAIVDAIAKEKCEEVHITALTGFGYSSLDFGESVEPEIVRTFYDSFSKRYFTSTIQKVIQAEYHLNRNFMWQGVISLNAFYEFLGLEPMAEGDSLGWTALDGYYWWIEFDHHTTILADGTEVCVIDMISEPVEDFDSDC